MDLSKELEEKIKTRAISYLEKGKPNWDVPHTLNAVDWMKKLIKEEGGNEKILLTAMYLHDIGYSLSQMKGYSFDEVMEAKKDHAELGALESKKILNELDEFSQEEVNEICKLITNHNNKELILTLNPEKDEYSHNQILVREADGLSKIDWYHVTPNFDIKRYFEYYKERSVPCFKTETGKKFLKEILQKAEEYLKDMPE
jgi:HD superfamily phosphodiesterase